MAGSLGWIRKVGRPIAGPGRMVCRFGRRVRWKARDFRVPVIGLRVMTDAALHEKLIGRYEDGRKHERQATNRQMSQLLNQNALLSSQNMVMQHRLKKVR